MNRKTRDAALAVPGLRLILALVLHFNAATRRQRFFFPVDLNG